MTPELKAKIEAIKKNGHTVMQTVLAGEEYIFRSINRLEWREFQKTLNDRIRGSGQDGPPIGSKEEGEDDIVTKALVSPAVVARQDILGMPAGIVTQLADLILKVSGFALAEEPTLTKL